jgi:hypothetical protein
MDFFSIVVHLQQVQVLMLEAASVLYLQVQVSLHHYLPSLFLQRKVTGLCLFHQVKARDPFLDLAIDFCFPAGAKVLFLQEKVIDPFHLHSKKWKNLLQVKVTNLFHFLVDLYLAVMARDLFHSLPIVVLCLLEMVIVLCLQGQVALYLLVKETAPCLLTKVVVLFLLEKVIVLFLLEKVIVLFLLEKVIVLFLLVKVVVLFLLEKVIAPCLLA